MPKKLPPDIFADSPLRATHDSDAIGAQETQTKARSTTAPLRIARSETAKKQPEVSPTPLSTPNTRKLTVYLPDAFVQAIDDEVYRRRKGGDRSFSFADLHREIVEEWVARKAKDVRATS